MGDLSKSTKTTSMNFFSILHKKVFKFTDPFSVLYIFTCFFEHLC